MLLADDGGFDRAAVKTLVEDDRLAVAGGGERVHQVLEADRVPDPRRDGFDFNLDLLVAPVIVPRFFWRLAPNRLNPLTVLKGYQELVDEGLVEKKRGRGMFVNEGAQTQLLQAERERFLEFYPDQSYEHARMVYGPELDTWLAEIETALASGDAD